MNAPVFFEAYLHELSRALSLYPGKRSDVLDEVRDHLLERHERAIQEGCPSEEAERRALKFFGEPALLARPFVEQKSRARVRWLLPLALAIGVGIAYVDSRPGWDDTGVSAFAVLVSAGLLGLCVPARAWLWAAAIGCWIPLLGVLQHGNYAALLALAFALAGAWGGRFVRQLAAA